mmetsp:Transcript_128487/g.274023  ORF Transcript_128487/g.274023 Transcript_128487/m.274023 type:complete len:160 (-) Transcript_128487:43-522(-)
MPQPSFGKYNDMNSTLTPEQKADGWKYSMTKEQEWDKLGFVMQDQIRFRLHVQDGLLDVVEDYLLTDKIDLIDINFPDAAGMTPLMIAASKGHKEIVAALLQAKADPNLADKSVESEKITALDYANGYPHQVGCEKMDICAYIISSYMQSGAVPAIPNM